jgi:ribosomal protein S18 acetylase RimI-like enzyme
MQMRANYEQLGITVEPADFRDVLGIVCVQATTFVDTYHTEDVPGLAQDNPHFMPKEVIERFVYTSDFLDRKIYQWRDHIENQSSDKEILVAKHGKEVVGFSHSIVEEREGSLNALFILPDYQRRYLGQALIRNLLERSDTQEIRLDVVQNTPAVNFYQHFGFTILQSLPAEQCPEMKPGKWLPLFSMKRQVINSA